MQVSAGHGPAGDLLQRNRVELQLQFICVDSPRVDRPPELSVL